MRLRFQMIYIVLTLVAIGSTGCQIELGEESKVIFQDQMRIMGSREHTNEQVKEFHNQTYEMPVNDEINMQWIKYICQRSPDSYTLEEMDEIHNILFYIMEEPPEQNVNDFMLPSQQVLTQKMFDKWLEKMALNKLFRGYSAALNTTYVQDVSRIGDMNRLGEYFYKNTLQRLTATDGSLDSEQLNCIMKLNPDSLTVGDYRALSEVFDWQVSGTDMESMNRANIFLANCYINAEVNSTIKVDAERSQVFDKWAEYYLSQEANKTTLNDFEILADPKANEKREVNIKFLKQALLQIISSNVAFKLQIWSEDVSVDSGARNSLIGVFDIVSLMTGGIGDYHLTMYQSDKKPGKKIEIEYYRYRESSGMSTLFGQSVINTYGKSNKGFLSDIKEKIRGIFSSGWKEQKKREKVENLSKYYDGCEMEAYQQSGQVMYVNGFKIINNLNVDEECIEFLQKKFKEQVESSKYYDEFFLQAKSKEEREAIERGLHNPDSIEYRNAYINWYLEGIGDDGHTTGKEYKKIYEMGKE